MTVISGQEITEYVAQVRAALADLPPDVRRELLEDLPEHLAEVGAEADGSLVDRLGPPEAYAAELRTAAGVPETATPTTVDDRILAAFARARRRLAVLDRKAGPLFGATDASDFFQLLRPAWWVLRGYLAVLVVAMLSGSELGVLPRLGGSVLAGFVLLVAAVLGSIWLGRRRAGLGRVQRLLVNSVGALIVVIGLVGLLGVDGRARSGGYYSPTYNDNPYSNVQDLYIYDSEGRLVQGGRIFDQDGRPIELGNPGWCPDATVDPAAASGRTRYVYPFCPGQAPFHGIGAQPGPSGTPVPSAAPGSSGAPAPSGTPGPLGTATPSGIPAPSGIPVPPAVSPRPR